MIGNVCKLRRSISEPDDRCPASSGKYPYWADYSSQPKKKIDKIEAQSSELLPNAFTPLAYLNLIMITKAPSAIDEKSSSSEPPATQCGLSMSEFSRENCCQDAADDKLPEERNEEAPSATDESISSGSPTTSEPVVEYANGLRRPLGGHPWDAWWPIATDDEERGNEEEFNFERGPLVVEDCSICHSQAESTYSRQCCGTLICDECITMYIETSISDGRALVKCPGHKCDRFINKNEVCYHIRLNMDLVDKYLRYLANANNEPGTKTCPHCCFITKLDEPESTKYGIQIVCQQCSFHWCFNCHGPEHPSMTCKAADQNQYCLKQWAKKLEKGQKNARKCPKCKVFIQREKGCDQMQCTKCDTVFCYGCGARRLSVKFLGNHYSRFSILGCPKVLWNGKRKHLRRFIRGSVFAGQITAITIVGGVAVCLVPVAAVAALLAAPTFGFTKLHRHLKMKRQQKVCQRLRGAEPRRTSFYCNMIITPREQP